MIESGPLEFTIKRSGDEYLDLSSAYLHLAVIISVGEVTNLTEADKASPVNNSSLTCTHSESLVALTKVKGFQRLPPARGRTAQGKIFHRSHLIHPGPSSSRSSFFYGFELVVRGNTDSLLN